MLSYILPDKSNSPTPKERREMRTPSTFLQRVLKVMPTDRLPFSPEI